MRGSLVAAAGGAGLAAAGALAGVAWRAAGEGWGAAQAGEQLPGRQGAACKGAWQFFLA